MEILSDWLINADKSVFHWINSGWSSGFLDALLPWCRERFFWAPLYVFLLAFILLNVAGKGKYILILGLVLAVGLADFTSSTLIKKQVRRLRPCNDPEMVVVARAPCGGGYSFTSSHACNHFALAFFLMPFFRRVHRRLPLCLGVWAALIAVSQVYVGVHYPLDIAVGGLLGAFIGAGVARVITIATGGVV
jgi:membrane-associated phospholipid phosphatase